jgi:COMPASS component SWD2
MNGDIFVYYSLLIHGSLSLTYHCAFEKQIIHLYDARQYSSGAFSEMKLDSNTLLNALQTKGHTAQPHIASELSRAKWSSMTFNKSGKQILITTELGLVLVVDGYDANIVTHVFSAEDMSGEGSQSAKPAAACFSSDDQTVLVGNENGSISCYDVVSGLLVKKLDGHVGHVGCVASSPKYAQIASACTNVALWTW